MKKYIFASFLLHVVIFISLAFSDFKTHAPKKPPLIKITILKQERAKESCVKEPKNEPDMPKNEIQKPPKKEPMVATTKAQQPLVQQKITQAPVQNEISETKPEPQNEIKTQVLEARPTQEPKTPPEVKQPPVEKIIQKKVEKPKPQVSHADIQKVKNSYLEKITKILNEKKEYPKNALKLSQEGVVKIRFRLLQNGEITNCSIAESSSYKLLDNATLKLLNDISNFEPFPKELQEPHMDITIPVEYKLN